MFRFTAFGHKNILATHKTTIEFTKDNHLTKQGDCIVGINSDFDYFKLKKYLKDKTCLQLTIKLKDGTEELTETITFKINHEFNHKQELVIRKTDFLSDRTLGIHADKASIDLNRELINKLKNPEQKITIELCENN